MIIPMNTDFLRLSRHPHFALPLPRHFFLGLFIFAAAYLTTFTVNAGQPGAVQLLPNGEAVVVGTVVEADEDYVIVDSAGTQMKITLDDLELRGETDLIFKPGMEVTAEGEMNGHDFGTPILVARNITAREIPVPAAR